MCCKGRRIDMRFRVQRGWKWCAALVVAILAGPVLTRAQEHRAPSPGNPQSFPVQQASRNEPARFDGTSGEKQLLLSPPRHDAAADKSSGGSRMLGAIISVVVSLAVVLGLFFIVAWFMRRGLPNSTRRLPAEVVEVLGRTPLAGRQQMHLLRFGNKLLLVCAFGHRRRSNRRNHRSAGNRSPGRFMRRPRGHQRQYIVQTNFRANGPRKGCRSRYRGG